MKTIDVEFLLGDEVYYTFSPTLIIAGVVNQITIFEDGIMFRLRHKNGNGSSTGWNLNNGTQNIYVSEEAARMACEEWAKEGYRRTIGVV
jgi:hypothetical protein